MATVDYQYPAHVDDGIAARFADDGTAVVDAVCAIINGRADEVID
jgi:hypothetical protein